MLERSFGARGTDLQSRWLHGNRQASPGAIRQGFRHLFGASLRLPPLRPIWFCAYPCPHAGHTPPSAAGQVELRWIGNQVNASVRRLGRCRAIPVRRSGKTAAGVAYFSRPAITVIAPARNLKGPTCESTSKHEISTPERFKARPIRLQPAHHIMRCCCWQHTRRVSSALPVQ